MRNQILRIVLVLCVIFPVSGQAQVLWEITSSEGHKSWLLGTMHTEDARVLDFSPALKQVMGQAEMLAVELVPDSEMMEELAGAMNYSGDKRLPDFLDETLYEQVVEILETHYGMGEPLVRRMRPWAVGMTLSVPPPETGMFMDLVLIIQAGARGMEVKGLETMEEQLSFLRDIPADDQIELIRRAVEEYHRMDEVFEELVAAYLSGDLGELERVAEEQMSEWSPSMRMHFEEQGMRVRNEKMVERALPLAEAGGVLIAVGALHLPGESGLIRGFRNAGFDVHPVE